MTVAAVVLPAVVAGPAHQRPSRNQTLRHLDIVMLFPKMPFAAERATADPQASTQAMCATSFNTHTTRTMVIRVELPLLSWSTKPKLST